MNEGKGEDYSFPYPLLHTNTDMVCVTVCLEFKVSLFFPFVTLEKRQHRSSVSDLDDTTNTWSCPEFVDRTCGVRVVPGYIPDGDLDTVGRYQM
jgi:hypothetical protein